MSPVDEFLKDQLRPCPPGGWTPIEFDDWSSLLQTEPGVLRWTWLNIEVPAGTLHIYCDADSVPTVALISVPEQIDGRGTTSLEVRRYRFTPADPTIDLGMDPIPGLTGEVA